MPTTKLPEDQTKVSYILPKKDKLKLEREAKRAGCSMSALISLALDAFFRSTHSTSGWSGRDRASRKKVA